MEGERRPTTSVWSQSGFLPFWTAGTVSGFGDYVSALAIQVLVVVTLHQGAAGVGLVQAAVWLPYLLFGIVVGVLVDRLHRRPLLIGTDLLRGMLLIGIPALAAIHELTLTALVAFMAAFGVLSLLNDAASQSFLPRLVSRTLLVQANARIDQADAVAQTSGPALAGALVSLLSAPWAVLVDAVSYWVSGALLLRLDVVEPPRRPSSLRAVRREAAEGLRWVYTHATLRPLAVSTHVWFLFLALAGAVETSFALHTLGLSAFGLGLALAAGGVGGLAGSLVATGLGKRYGAGRVVIASYALSGLAWTVAAAGPRGVLGWILFGVGQLMWGFSIGADNANSLGYRQMITPDELQGRTNATMRSINRAMIVIGAPLGGLLGDALGFRLVLLISAVGFLATAAATTMSRVRHVRIDDELISQEHAL